MPQTPRRNSQTNPNWAEHLSANRYAAGAAVAALLAAYLLGELWFPDLNVAVAPKAGTLVIYANVKRDDYLAPEPRTRHAHRALADGASHHVRALEAWVHLFPFREAHTHTCIAPHGAYRSGEYDDEASELRHRRERLLALRRARAAAAADGV